MGRLSAAIAALFEKHKFVRRALLAWVVWLITSITLHPPEYLTSISEAGRDVILGVVGLLTVVIGFYQWHRKQEDQSQRGDRDG